MHYVANRKMTKTRHECKTYCHTLRTHVKQWIREGEDLVFLAVPSVYLQWCQEYFADIACVQVMAQDCSGSPIGRATGQIHPSMIASLGVTRTMIGHSETRSATERNNSDTIRAKLYSAHDAGLSILYCCGETTKHQTLPDAQSAVIAQIDHELGPLLTDQHPSSLMIGYEPCWAIGSDASVPLDHISAMIKHIHHHYPQITRLYGGSVDEHTIATLRTIPHLDGVLLGRAGQEIDRLGAVITAIH